MADEVYYSRRKARKHAVEIGYSALLRDVAATELLRATAAETGWSRHPWYAYCREIVSGVADGTAELDELLASSSEHWAPERMARIDLAILRVGAWEIAHNAEVPNPVAISEAVALANELSTDRSGTFVNGVLAKVATQV